MRIRNSLIRYYITSSKCYFITTLLHHNFTTSLHYFITAQQHFLYLPMLKKRILVAPLNWGLGHATRCIPIIRELSNQNFEPVIASDGAALDLLKKEFPELEHYTLPSYNIQYPKNSMLFTWKLLTQTPHILRNILAEKKSDSTPGADQKYFGNHFR